MQTRLVFIDLYWNCERESHRLLAPSFGAFKADGHVFSNRIDQGASKSKKAQVDYDFLISFPWCCFLLLFKPDITSFC